MDEPELIPQHSLWGEWLLDEYSTTHLRISKRPKAFLKDIGRQALTTVTALAIAFALAISVYASTLNIGWLTWPLVALFLGVAILGLFGVVRAIRQALGGIRLEVDASQKALWGMAISQNFWKGYMAKVQRHGLQQVRAVVLHTYRAERKNNHAMCELVVELNDGQRLQGPDVWAPEAVHDEAQQRLHPLAEAISHIANVPLELKEAPLPPPPRAPFAFFRSKSPECNPGHVDSEMDSKVDDKNRSKKS
jgi:hypothetical protein